MRYRVTVIRTSYAETGFEIDADSPEAARLLALEAAGDHHFSEHDADYDVEYLVPVLKAGDRVFWNDPDDGACSREYVIKAIEFRPGFVRITDVSGDVLECPPEELSDPK